PAALEADLRRRVPADRRGLAQAHGALDAVLLRAGRRQRSHVARLFDRYLDREQDASELPAHARFRLPADPAAATPLRRRRQPLRLVPSRQTFNAQALSASTCSVTASPTAAAREAGHSTVKRTSAASTVSDRRGPRKMVPVTLPRQTS